MTVEQIEELIRRALSAGLAVVVILAGPTAAPGSSGQSPATTTMTPRTSPSTAQTAAPSSAAPTTGPSRAQPGEGTTAAATYGWGAPNREDDFDSDLSGWSLYDGPGHAGNGRRSPSAATVANGVLTVRGDAHGTTEGMAWNNGHGQKYGRWEGRVKAPASDPTYNALLLLWPDADNFPIGGELDFMEMTDHTRRSTNLFLHHGADNAQVHGAITIDATQWHNWAVEWTPKGVTAYVDGKPWWHTDDATVLPPGPMHLCVQLDWFPTDGRGAVAPSQMQVDWVRQYAVGS
jgi:Glycosyl hydrolases family 16